MERLDAELKRAARNNESLSLVMIDIDNMKEINDRNGHSAGDFALTSLTQHLYNCSRSQDVICRYGGDEFAVLLPSTGHKGTELWMERVKQQRTPSMPHFSAGGAVYPTTAHEIPDLIRAADEALYTAKAFNSHERQEEMDENAGETINSEVN